MGTSRRLPTLTLCAATLLGGARDAAASEGEGAAVGREEAEAASAREGAAEGYDAALARARAAALRGEPREAARILSPVVEAYPQDYEVALQLGCYSFSAGDYASAERAYREALVRAPAGVDARLGLAWTLVRRGRCEDAKLEIRPLEREPRADDVTAACAAPAGPPEPPTTLSFAFTRWQFPGDSLKTGATGLFVGASERVSSEWSLGLSYRYASVDTQQTETRFAPPPGAPPGAPPMRQVTTTTSRFAQNEAYAHAAWSSLVLGLGLHAALVSEGSGTLGTSEHVGMVGRWSPFGDLLVDVSVSRYRDETVSRIAPSWTLPIAGPLRLVPGLAVQRVGGATLASASLSVLLDWPGLSLWAGGKYGQEERPAYLAQSIVYDLTDRVTWGAWGGLRLRLGDGIGLAATYAYDRLRVSGSAQGQTSAVQTLSVGPVFSF